MARYAIIKDGIVQNCTVMEDGADWKPPEGSSIVKYDKYFDPAPSSGDRWDALEGYFIKKEIPVKVEDPAVTALREKLGLTAEEFELINST